MSSPRYKVFVSGVGNIFMEEIAEALVVGIEATGRRATLHSSGLPGAEPETLNLVVAPHEFYPLQKNRTEAELVRAAATSIAIGVEQPGTSWFELEAKFASYGPLALEVNRHGAGEARRRGLESYHLQIGYHHPWDHLKGAPLEKRTTDVLFLGALTPRRAQFLAHAAPLLSEWSCDLRLFEITTPVRSRDNFVTGQEKFRLLHGARVLLNVHQGARDYFEWVRVMEAICNGCLVVTETATGYRPLVPMEHFVQADIATLGGCLDAILRDEAWSDEIAQRGYEFARSRLDFPSLLDGLLGVLEQRLQPWLRALVPPAVAVGRSERKGPRQTSRQPHGGQVHVGPTPGAVDPAQETRARIKHLLMREIVERRRIEALISAIETGARCRIDVVDSSSYRAAEPEVSVVVPVYNYAHYLRDAVESVIASRGVPWEIVIVDDHSNDASVAVAHRLLVEYSVFPIRLVTQSANRGPSATRNLGVENARGDYVFLLDADNVVYPSGLQLLVDRLRDSDAAFAYGIIEDFGDTTGLRSALPWDVQRLVRGPYIDAMAMIKTEVWKDVGGFDPEVDQEGGWDDYEFWLHLAAEGLKGSLVTEVVGRYRSHPASWQETVNLDTARLRAVFRARYPQLPWWEEE